MAAIAPVPAQAAGVTPDGYPDNRPALVAARQALAALRDLHGVVGEVRTVVYDLAHM
jgi:hypothetical protein